MKITVRCVGLRIFSRGQYAHVQSHRFTFLRFYILRFLRVCYRAPFFEGTLPRPPIITEAPSLRYEHRQTIRGDDEYTACMSSICVYAKYGNMSHKQKKILFIFFWHDICIVILVFGKFYRQIWIAIQTIIIRTI